MVETPVSKRAAASRGLVKPTSDWTDCLKLETSGLQQNLQLMWTLVAELDAGRCKNIGAHQLSNLLENLAPLQHRALLDNVGKHFIQRLLSYGKAADPCGMAVQLLLVTLLGV